MLFRQNPPTHRIDQSFPALLVAVHSISIHISRDYNGCIQLPYLSFFLPLSLSLFYQSLATRNVSATAKLPCARAKRYKWERNEGFEMRKKRNLWFFFSLLDTWLMLRIWCTHRVISAQIATLLTAFYFVFNEQARAIRLCVGRNYTFVSIVEHSCTKQ